MASIVGNCSVCAKAIISEHSEINHFLCQCGELYFKNKHGILQNSSSHVIKNNFEPIQKGTEGRWQNKRFVVLGRYRLWFAESIFNYWSILFDDGSIQMLAEGYGLYAIYKLFNADLALSVSTLDGFVFDTSIQIEGLDIFYFIRKNDCRFWDGEGQFYKSEVSIIDTFDAISNEGAIVEVFRYADKHIEVYQVYYCELEDLELKNLRNLDKAPQKKVVCRSCSNEMSLFTYPYSQSWSCTFCSAKFYMLNGREVEVGNDTKNNNLFDKYFEIGSTVVFEDFTFTVLGFLVKKDVQFDAYWTEYILHNPLKGYRFLNESDGHWILVKEMGKSPAMNIPHRHSFEFEGQEYSLFNRYTFKIEYAKGEFPGNVFNDEFNMGVLDYIAPPLMLSFEKSKKEGATWYRAEHVSRDVLQKQSANYLPQKYNVGPIEPKGVRDMSVFIKLGLFAFFILLMVHLIVGFNQQEKTLLSQDFYFSDSSGTQSYIVDEIVLTKWKSNIELEVNAPVDNTWFELQATLINKENGDEYTIEQGVEYYSGVDEGESWAEGSRSETTFFSSVPRGKYLLKITALKDISTYRPWSSNLNTFYLKLTNDVPMARNFWLLLLPILIWPFYAAFITNKNEKERWSNSPFTKYQ